MCIFRPGAASWAYVRVGKEDREGILAADGPAGCCTVLVRESGWLDMVGIVGYGCREGGAQRDGTVVCPVDLHISARPRPAWRARR